MDTKDNVLRQVALKKSILALSVSAAIACSITTQAQDDLEEITVTGSRIRMTSGMATPVPVTVVTTQELQALNPGASVVEQMGQLPQFFNTQSSQRGSGTLFAQAGGSYLNMRNLGTNRTLILLDGSRLPPADKRGSVNVDMMPTALMRSVDTVTGGASAAYGADALGGVVNFILDREFQGLKFNVGAGRTEWGDGDRFTVEVAGGTQIGDRLNVIGSFNANEIEEIQRTGLEVAEREDWYSNYGHVTNPDWRPGSNVPQRLTVPCVSPTDRSATGMLWSRNGNSTSTRTALTNFAFNGMVLSEDGQSVRQFVKAPYYARPGGSGSTTTMGGDCSNPEYRLYESGRNAVSGRNVVNRSGFVGAQYQFSDNLTGFVQALSGRSESRFNNNLGGMNFTGSWTGFIYRDNAFLSPQLAQAMDDAGIDVFQVWKNEQPANEKNLDYGYEESGVFGTWAWATGFNYTFENNWELRASWQSG